MWKIEYLTPKGFRTNRGFSSVCVFSNDLWYSYEHDKWLPYDQRGNQGCSTHHNKPKTIKAFKRYLRKHTELRGYKVSLVHREYITDKDGSWLHDLHVDANWEE